MENKPNIDMKYILDNLLDDETISKSVKKLQDAITELSIVISKKIAYSIAQDTPILISENQSPTPEQNTQKKTRKRKINWAESPNHAISCALSQRRKSGRDIEPELLAEIQKRFPSYNPETKKITRRSTRITDWKNATPEQVRAARIYRRATTQTLEPGLIAALQKLFPNYDAATDTFTKKAEWSTKTKKQLQNAVSSRKKRNKDIPTELATALAEKSTPCKKTTRTDWTNAPKLQLRAAYYYRIKNKQPIEQSLNDALIAAFPGYNPATQQFTGIRQKIKTIPVNKSISVPERLFPLYSVKTPGEKYILRFNNNKTETNLLIAGAKPYEVCLIDTVSKLAVIRKTINETKFALYIINYKTGKIIPETKSGIATVLYSPATHELFARKHRDTINPQWKICPDKSAVQVINAPTDLPQIAASQIKKSTVLLIDKNSNCSTHPLLILGDFDKNDEQNQTINQMLTAAKNAIADAPKQKPDNTVKTNTPTIREVATIPTAPKTTEEIPVYIEHVKSDLQGAYNNVYINGKKVLTNHYGTKTKLLFDNTLLAIHGIITDNHDFPQKPIWQIYDTSLKSRISLQKQKFSGYNIHATAINERNDDLQIALSNRCVATLKRDRIIKEARNKRFYIAQQKTK